MDTPPKPRCKLSNTDGNIFALGARASQALKHAGLADQVADMQHRILRSTSYDEAIRVIMDYVDVH